MDEEDDGLHVRAPTLEDLARLCRSLNDTAARYILIGGFAVIAHGGGRTTKDILDLAGTQVPLASKRTLIATKQTIRPSDRLDVDFLTSLIEEEKTR
jgi:hypothetical protein